MTDCCQIPATPSASANRWRCPQCAREGQPVDLTTVQALLSPQAAEKITDGPYQFCETPQCPIVYYAADGSVFDKPQIRVRVGLKETEDPIPVCYCFSVTKRMIQDEVQRTGRSTASPRIRAEIKAGNCRCEVENPSGQCCLGEVRQAEKQVVARCTERTHTLTQT